MVVGEKGTVIKGGDKVCSQKKLRLKGESHTAGLSWENK